jgi:hypothetical protein
MRPTLANKLSIRKKKMSLTSLIKSDKELRDKISTTFLRPKLEKSMPLLAEPLTKNYSLVGTAFDYIFRFFLEMTNNVQNSSKLWIAEQAIINLSSSVVNSEAYETGSEIINNVKKLKKEFTENGNLSYELIRQTLRMSYIDPVFRAGTGIKYIGLDADKADIEDIEKQFSLIEEELFRSKEICLLNPTFGKASSLVDGADADFLIDDKLIDIKTTKKLELSLNNFCQIIGYLVLHMISGIDGRKEVEINQLGIYYSRYGYLFLFDIHELIDDSSLQAFTEWFEDRVRQQRG